MPAKVDPESLIEVVVEADRPLTRKEIADRADVSRQTVRNYSETIEGDDRVKYATVGKNVTYWSASEDLESESDTNDEPDENRVEEFAGKIELGKQQTIAFFFLTAFGGVLGGLFPSILVFSVLTAISFTVTIGMLIYTYWNVGRYLGETARQAGAVESAKLTLRAIFQGKDAIDDLAAPPGGQR